MKSRRKNTLLALSLLGVMILGGLFAKFLEPESLEEPTVVTNAVSVTPDVRIYSQTASTIIVGTVKEITNHPNKTDIPYPRTILDAQVEVEEVLKGDPAMTSIVVTMIGESENVLSEDKVTLMEGERVLLFLGTDGDGNTVFVGGDASKSLIDENDNVTGESVFTMPLANLKAKIKEALEQSN